MTKRVWPWLLLPSVLIAADCPVPGVRYLAFAVSVVLGAALVVRAVKEADDDEL